MCKYKGWEVEKVTEMHCADDVKVPSSNDGSLVTDALLSQALRPRIQNMNDDDDARMST